MSRANVQRLSLRTPEHVPLNFELASVGGRILAFMLDMTIVFSAIILLAVLAGLALDSWFPSDAELILEAFLLLAIFFIWNFYFIVTELRWQGRTIGKRVVGLRVIARDGGPLAADLVFARNLTRDLETLIPILVIAFPETLGVDSPVVIMICWLWLGILTFMPLFNRNHARVGDLIAGTIVVNAAQQRLRKDLVADVPKPKDAEDKPEFVFTQEQLDLYGIHELQILEDVLRRYPRTVEYELLETISAKVRRKIAWPDERGEPNAYRFLRAFYSAQRGRLEHKLLFGKRQERKVR